MTTQGIDTTQTEAFVERLFGATLGAIDVMSVYLGDRLGLYRSLGFSPSARKLALIFALSASGGRGGRLSTPSSDRASGGG